MQRIGSTDFNGLTRSAAIGTHWHVPETPLKRAGATRGQNTTGDRLKSAPWGPIAESMMNKGMFKGCRARQPLDTLA
jgi:hypothetical protein